MSGAVLCGSGHKGNELPVAYPPPTLRPAINNIQAYLNVNGFKWGKVIGEGSYSKVRLTTRVMPDGTMYRLASKVINKKKASEDFVTKFLPRELKLVTRLEHPNIVKVYDIVEFDHHVYIFMDWCERGDLLEYIKVKGHIGDARSRSYFSQILSAVKYLHSQDIAHRDLKCENVLLESRDLVKLSDFGFARYCRDKTGKRVLSNTYCGSAAYAAPEILQGINYNPKLYDMWSLGCVLFIMLTGHMPYDEADVPKMLKNQQDRILVYPSHVESEIAISAKSLISHLLEPDVTRRATIEQVVNHPWVKVDQRPRTSAGAGDQHTYMAPPTYRSYHRSGQENAPFAPASYQYQQGWATMAPASNKAQYSNNHMTEHDYAQPQTQTYF